MLIIPLLCDVYQWNFRRLRQGFDSKLFHPSSNNSSTFDFNSELIYAFVIFSPPTFVTSLQRKDKCEKKKNALLVNYTVHSFSTHNKQKIKENRKTRQENMINWDDNCGAVLYLKLLEKCISFHFLHLEVGISTMCSEDGRYNNNYYELCLLWNRRALTII